MMVVGDVELEVIALVPEVELPHETKILELGDKSINGCLIPFRESGRFTQFRQEKRFMRSHHHLKQFLESLGFPHSGFAKLIDDLSSNGLRFFI